MNIIKYYVLKKDGEEEYLGGSDWGHFIVKDCLHARFFKSIQEANAVITTVGIAKNFKIILIKMRNCGPVEP